MPKGDPAGYLPSVKKMRQAAKSKSGGTYTTRAKRERLAAAPKVGGKRPKPPFSMTSKPKFKPGAAMRQFGRKDS